MKSVLFFVLVSILLMGNTQCQSPAPSPVEKSVEWTEVRSASLKVSVISIASKPVHSFVAIVDFEGALQDLKIETTGGDLVVNGRVYPVSDFAVQIFTYRWMFLADRTRLVLDLNSEGDKP